MTEYIFSAGTARGGTGLLTRMLSVNPKVEIALDPYLTIFRELRNCIAKSVLSDYSNISRMPKAACIQADLSVLHLSGVLDMPKCKKTLASK